MNKVKKQKLTKESCRNNLTTNGLQADNVETYCTCVCPLVTMPMDSKEVYCGKCNKDIDLESDYEVILKTEDGKTTRPLKCKIKRND